MCVSIFLHLGKHCAHSAHRSQKRILAPLELELQKFMSYYVGSGFSEEKQVFIPSEPLL